MWDLIGRYHHKDMRDVTVGQFKRATTSTRRRRPGGKLALQLFEQLNAKAHPPRHNELDRNCSPGGGGIA